MSIEENEIKQALKGMIPKLKDYKSESATIGTPTKFLSDLIECAETQEQQIKALKESGNPFIEVEQEKQIKELKDKYIKLATISGKKDIKIKAMKELLSLIELIYSEKIDYDVWDRIKQVLKK